MAVDSVNNFTGRGEIRSGAVRVAPLSGNQSTEAVGPKGATERPGFSTVMKEFVGDVNAVHGIHLNGDCQTHTSSGSI